MGIRPRPPGWREVTDALTRLEVVLERVLAMKRLPHAVRDELEAMLAAELRPLLRRVQR